MSHGLPRGPVSGRHQPRRARRPGAAHAGGRARLRRRGAQRLLGRLAPALRRRLRHPPRRRPRRGHRLLRGAERPAARLPLEGLGRLQVRPAVGAGHADRPGARHRRRRHRDVPAGEALRERRAGLGPADREAGRRHRAGRAWRRRAALRLVGERDDRRSSPSPPRPRAGVLVTAGFEFDVPVRFDTDRLDVTWDLDRLGSIASIPLVEVRR